MTADYWNAAGVICGVVALIVLACWNLLRREL